MRGTPADLSSALEDGGPGAPDPLPAHDVPSDGPFSVHKAPLLHGDVVVEVRFDGGPLLGHDLCLDGGNLFNGHGFRQRPGAQGAGVKVTLTTEPTDELTSLKCLIASIINMVQSSTIYWKCLVSSKFIHLLLPNTTLALVYTLATNTNRLSKNTTTI